MPEVRSIDANAEVKRLKNDYCEECTKKGNYGIFGVACTPCWVKDAVEEFENAPTIKAEPVRHGRWIKQASDMFDCSECGESIYWIFSAKKCSYGYCPNCGVKMDGGDEQ